MPSAPCARRSQSNARSLTSTQGAPDRERPLSARIGIECGSVVVDANGEVSAKRRTLRRASSCG